MRYFILGSTGMLGHKVVNQFNKNDDIVKRSQEIVALSSKDYNFANSKDIYKFRDSLNKDDIVINCCGMIKPSILKYDYVQGLERAFYVNSFMPHVVSRKCKFISISTDCSFSGKKGKHIESDLPDAEDVYGRTKVLGEPIDNAMVIRTSIIGKEVGTKQSLYEWFMMQKNQVNGFTNHYWNGLTTNQLAKCIEKIVNSPAMLETIGVYHVFSDIISKYELLRLFNMHRTDPITINEVEAKVALDRTLNTVYPFFVEFLEIPPLNEQVKEMCLNFE